MRIVVWSWPRQKCESLSEKQAKVKRAGSGTQVWSVCLGSGKPWVQPSVPLKQNKTNKQTNNFPWLAEVVPSPAHIMVCSCLCIAMWVYTHLSISSSRLWNPWWQTAHLNCIGLKKWMVYAHMHAKQRLNVSSFESFLPLVSVLNNTFASRGESWWSTSVIETDMMGCIKLEAIFSFSFNRREHAGN
jgi:hypothetical protein